MPQIPTIPTGDRYGAIGSTIGSLLSGLGSVGAGAITHSQEKRKEQEIKDFLVSQGYSEEDAKRLASLGPQVVGQIMQEKMKQQTRAQQVQGFTEAFRGQGPGAISQAPEEGAPTQLSTDQIMQQAAQSGLYGPNQIIQLQRTLQEKEKLAFQREQFQQIRQLKEEAPQRAQMVKEVAVAVQSDKVADRKIADLERLVSIADDPSLRAGGWKQALDRWGIGDLFQSPITHVADKLIGDINLASLSEVTTPGKATAQILREIAKTNPSLVQTPDAIKVISKIKILAAKVDKAIGTALRKIEAKSPRGFLPIDTISKARKLAEPEIEEIHEKQKDLAKSLRALSKKDTAREDTGVLTMREIQRLAPPNPPEGAIIYDDNNVPSARYVRGNWVFI